MISVLKRDRREEVHGKTGRDWSDAVTAKEHLVPPEAGRGKIGFCNKASRGSIALPTP